MASETERGGHLQNDGDGLSQYRISFMHSSTCHVVMRKSRTGINGQADTGIVKEWSQPGQAGGSAVEKRPSLTTPVRPLGRSLFISLSFGLYSNPIQVRLARRRPALDIQYKMAPMKPGKSKEIHEASGRGGFTVGNPTSSNLPLRDIRCDQ